MNKIFITLVLASFFVAGLCDGDCLVENCAQCTEESSNVCAQCNTGYFLNSTDNTTCGACISGCDTCTTNTTCQNCTANFDLNTTSGQCFQICNLTGCTECNTPNNATCKTCSIGTFVNETGLCQSCGVGCANCSNATNCTNCSNSFFLNTTAGNCSACSANCNTCTDENTCTSCGGATYLNGTFCSNCMANCTACTSNETCSACANNMTFNTVKKVCSGYRTTFMFAGVIIVSIIALLF